MKNLDEKVIVIAGGSGGIGSTVYKKLLLLNAKVIGISRTENIHMKNFARCNHYDYDWITSDLTLSANWEDALNEIKNKYGKIDVLINSVGTLIPGKFENLTSNQIEEIISTNFTSFITASKVIISLMKKQGFGHIINLGSLGGIIPMPYESLYSATKFALRGFTLSLKLELNGTGIKVSLVSPGPVLTKMLKKESLDSDSTIAFVNKPLSADFIADKIIRIISHPKLEIVLPTGTKSIAFLLSLFPQLFSLIYPILNLIGKKNKHNSYLIKAFEKDGLYEQ
jgi:short-subunit dehydrogenase